MTDDPVVALIKRYLPFGVLVDTNILLLYLIGSFDRNLITTFKRVSDRFIPEDFDLLNAFLPSFRAVFTTPNILTEVSNLAGQLPEHVKKGFFLQLAQVIPTMTEQSIESRIAAEHSHFPVLGLTDCGS